MKKYLIMGISTIALSACGGSQNGSSSAADSALAAAATINKMGPPLSELVSHPELAEAHSCDGGHKLQICHVPPGNPDARHTLCVDEHAITSHLREHDGSHHGGVADYLGDCAGSSADDGSGGSAGDETGGTVTPPPPPPPPIDPTTL